MADVSAKIEYQVLARKWRPRAFESMVGQQHVLKALINALNNNRLHHAYLFSGTRGVGKTTLGRILAKCLNCLKGVSALPCGECDACTAIDAGRFVDLFEIDAASRTKVEDTRELLDNVQYAPVQGRFKIYLIDEVHMLSGHSFNALLKTLEEPPPHVKFILATTDPQRLPVTVLSRCLQFHLKNLATEQIAGHLSYVLQQENISFESSALAPLAQAANGSMRDALSLLDQAIAYSDSTVTLANVATMLGTIPHSHVINLLNGLAKRDIEFLFEEIKQLVALGIDFAMTLEALLASFHELAIAQFLPDSLNSHEQANDLRELARLFQPEELQLYYQIALIGQRDLPLAPSPRQGFEMILLRMLAFQPNNEKQQKTSAAAAANPIVIPSKNVSAAPVSKPASPPPAASPATKLVNEISDWEQLINQLKLTGLTLEIAKYCALKELTNDAIHLSIENGHSNLLNKNQEERLASALSTHFGKPIRLVITATQDPVPSIVAKTRETQRLEQERAIQDLSKDANVQAILQTFDAKLQPDLIKSTVTD